MWEQTILENEFGLLPRIPNNVDFFHTPTTGQDGGSNSRKALKKRMEMWPTPTVGCVEGGEQSDRVERTINGGYILRKLNKPNMTYGAKLSDAVLFEEKKTQILTGGKLNPNWTEWLMGWPIEWTELKQLETDKYPYVQQPLGTFLKED
jgi:DNA (cytosine-5)-methyltransferase 1